ncbi:MAG: hypothetical protein ACQETC_04540 [Thermodesulfobacteriota bacterium]
MKQLAVFFSLFLAVSCFSGAEAGPLPANKVPEPLKPWTGWVLQGHDQTRCPSVYNNLSEKICIWPSRLRISFSNDRASFTQKWKVYQKNAGIALPGDRDLWPLNVTVDGTAHPVGKRNGKPYLILQEPGEYTVKGAFAYDRIPEKISVPGHTGLVDLSVRGESVRLPRLDKQGRLWIEAEDRKAGTAARKQGDGIRVKVHRLIRDDIPATVVTRVQLNVSGRHREERIGKAFTDRFVPVALDSPLPARLEKDGGLLLQVRPGTWEVAITLRHKGPLKKMSLEDVGGFRKADTEIWSFRPFSHLRSVDLKGPPRIDPERTTMPREWKEYPAFLMTPEEELVFSVKKRGDPDPDPDQLNLNRTLRLDFDGKGFSVIDRITGRMTTGWRLSANPPLELGRVTVNGKPVFITRLPGSDKAGVEMRYGKVNLKSRSRIDRSDSIPASGWNKTFNSVKGTLHLPPGWSLFSSSGIDSIRDTWVKQWTLLDIFVVLVICLAAAKLKGVRWGAVSLFALVLIRHQPGAPVWVWLHILAALALLRQASKGGRIYGVLNTYRVGCILFLVAVSLPFIAHQAKVGIYPQLEKPWKALPQAGRSISVSSDAHGGRTAVSQKNVQKEILSSPALKAGKNLYRQKGEMSEHEPADRSVKQVDTDAKIQTGLGIPSWQWNSVRFSWNGPVAGDRNMSFTLVSPTVNAFLSFARIVLLLVMIQGFSGVTYQRRKGFDFSGLKTKVALFITLFAFWCLPSPAEAENGFPPERLLKQLEEKLTVREKPECAPECAAVSEMDVTVDRRILVAGLEVHSLNREVAVPLPGSAGQWLPVRVKMNNTPVKGVYRDPVAGHLWIIVPEGVHRVELSGYIPDLNSFQVALPLKPGRVTVQSTDWHVEGIGDNGIPENRLKFSRIDKEAGEKEQAETFEPERLPPFLKITRTLVLGLDWEVQTVVRRVSPQGFSVVTSVPLLDGEAVTTDLPVKNGRAMISMGPNQSVVRWRSSLPVSGRLDLKAPETSVFTEIWKVDVATVWHAEMTGVPVIRHQGRSGEWLPEFRPWPGERLSIRIMRPEGVDGPTHTIENTRLDMVPGKRITKAGLEMDITSSRGGEHELVLPSTARLQSVSINGESRPIRLKEDTVTLPLTPGKQSIRLDWHEKREMGWKWSTSNVDLGMPGADSVITAKMPENRWILFCGGPYVGPAVLYWSMLLVIVILSAGLCRIKTVPLRFYQWVLLGVGMVQVNIFAALPVAAWLLALGARREYGHKQSNAVFNIVQVLLALLTAAAVASLFYGIQHGLLGSPDMQITGNGSHNHFLRWYRDMTTGLFPAAYVISLPMTVYRVLILLWALWIAFSFLKWLRWGFECFGTDGFRRRVNFRISRRRSAGEMKEDVHNE